MNTSQLKKFAQGARRSLMEQVSAQLSIVLAENSLARRESAKAITDLESEIREHGEAQTIEKAAYIWFNRFTALMFMDVNNYAPIRATIPADGETVPQILAEAKAGELDDDIPAATRKRVDGLLSGEISSREPEAEAYRLLLVAVCNQWHGAMPFMFEKIADWTELLMPVDLLSSSSILARMREMMTQETCTDVEIIGWLYQFYISEKKDEVFGRPSGKKIEPEDIPAATQQFTPHWIVRYLIENSLGRLWMLNRPSSRLIDQMSYYIAPEEPETDFLRISGPEEIRICDPACGSGHMLTYAFDLLHAIYEEEGYDVSEIPERILTHNLFGIEIDERAGALAAFALTMKARARQVRFFRRGLAPNICVLTDVFFTEQELAECVAKVGVDLFTTQMRETLSQFEQAKNFGSLIAPKLADIAEVASRIAALQLEQNLFLRDLQARVQVVLRMQEFLSPKYHVVVANPPYMGAKGMNARLKNWLRTEYPAAKSDLMTCFMERCHSLTVGRGYWAMINLPSWMFLGSYDGVRDQLLRNQSLLSLLQLGRGLFGPDFGTVAFCVRNAAPSERTTATYRRLFEKQVSVRRPEEIERLFLDRRYNCFSTRQIDLLRIPGRPIAYWLSDKFTATFANNRTFNDYFEAKQGLATGNNERFLRFWHEISSSDFDHSQTDNETFSSTKKWFPYSKGGEARKWYGNNELVIRWDNNGQLLKDFKDDAGNRLSTLKNLSYMFRPAVTWSLTSIGGILCTRFRPAGFVFDTNGMSAFSRVKELDVDFGVALLNSRFAQETLKVLNPTMAFQSGDIDRVPVPENVSALASMTPVSRLISLGRADWDSVETSWGFSTLPLLSQIIRADTFEISYGRLSSHWREKTLEMQRLEEENNRLFITAYGLEKELSSNVPLEQVTLTWNAAYRYGGGHSEDDLEALMRADTVRDFLSYSVGCMFGRYSLDAPGLIVANQAETLADFLERVPTPAFMPDRDNVIPVLDGDWFSDDIASRFRQFVSVTFGDSRLSENLTFIEEALGKDIRRYFLRDFYKDHIKRYKKRPIYWLFSSPKGSFNALIYMHRYRPDTASVILNDYLREFRGKLTVARKECERIEASGEASQRDKVQAGKDRMKFDDMLAEIDDYERKILFPLASQNIAIDLDDGVKVNYLKFGDALAKIPGLEAKDDG